MDEKLATAVLSTWQRQVVADLGIDAWYLAPLQPLVTSDDKAHQQLIDGLLGSISAHDAAISPAVAPSASVAPLTDTTDTTVTAVAESQSSPHSASASPSLSPSMSTMGNVPRAVGKVLEKTAVAGAGASSRRVLTPPPAIRVDTQHNIHPPEDEVLRLSASPDDLTWTAVSERAQQLAEQAQQPYCLGQGNQQATDCFMLPPFEVGRTATTDDISSALLRAPARQLLSELFTAIGIDFANGYQTPVLKYETPLGTVADDALLAQHLALLASELALIVPARIWLFGSVACRLVMQTAAPLSALMSKHYRLSYLDAQQQRQQAQLICLPEPDYLLALPAEKGKVWQRLKYLGSN